MTALSTMEGPGGFPTAEPPPSRPKDSAKPEAPATTPPADQNSLEEACAEFESLFIYYMLKEMRATTSGEGYGGDSMQSKTYASMFDLEIAREVSSQRGIGVADFLRRQLADRIHKIEAQNTEKTVDFR